MVILDVDNILREKYNLKHKAVIAKCDNCGAILEYIFDDIQEWYKQDKDGDLILDYLYIECPHCHEHIKLKLQEENEL